MILAAINAGSASTAFLVLGIVFLVVTVLLFFLFNIPAVFQLKTGKGAKRTIRRMKEENASTGRLRKNDVKIRTVESVATPPVTQQGSVHGTDDHSENSTTDVLDYAEKGTEVLETGGNSTTVLGGSETTVIHENETTVLNQGQQSQPVTHDQTEKIKYQRTTSGRFSVTYTLIEVHSDELA